MPTSGHTPTTTFINSPCGCCCINFGCGKPKALPDTLAFIASVSGSCPEASPAMVSGFLTYLRTAMTCEEQEADLTCNRSSLCGCRYLWSVADEDIPTCGPYISSVALACLLPINSPVPPHESVFGPVVGCDHLRKEKCYWEMVIEVVRAGFIRHSPPPCPAPPFPDPPTFAKQNCSTCEWECVLTDPGPDACCPTCPPCWTCSGCPPGEEVCCGTDGCDPCTLPECLSNPCNRCWTDFNNGSMDPSCDYYLSCGPVLMTLRRYTFYVTDCPDPDDLKGCNPTSCPPDEDNTGDFYLTFGCDVDDYIEVACP